MDCPECNTPMTFEDNGFYSESYLVCYNCGHKKEVERYSITDKVEVKDG